MVWFGRHNSARNRSISNIEIRPLRLSERCTRTRAATDARKLRLRL